MEILGTFAMSFFGPAAIVVGLLISSLNPVQRLFFDALVPGIAIFACIVSFAKYSGAHVNPAVTVTFAASGRFRSNLVIPYILFQFFGCLIAALALRAIFGSAVTSAALGSNMLGVGVNPTQGTILEIEEEIILCLIVLSVVSLVRGTAKQGIIVGITLTLMIFTYGPISGGSMNPFRSLAPALGAGYFEGQYEYLIGPPVGAAIAGVLFRFLEKAGRGPSR